MCGIRGDGYLSRRCGVNMVIGKKPGEAVPPDGSNFIMDPSQWDDLSAPALGLPGNSTSGRLANNFYNAGMQFNSNARYPEEPIVISIQLFHALMFGTGAVFRPHIHWYQSQAAVPNFLMLYKKIRKGTLTTVETDYSNYTFLTPVTNVWTWTSGTLYQLTTFGEIDTSEMELSDTFDIIFFRDSANASGLFAGSDPVATNVIVKYIDCHVQFNSLGSRQEFVK